MSILQNNLDGTFARVQMMKAVDTVDTEKTQKVLSLSMRALKDYLRGLKSATDGENLPTSSFSSLHRVDDLYAAADAHEQAKLLDKRKSLSREKNSQEDGPKKKQVKKG